MWILLMISIWSSGSNHSEAIGQFPTKDLCKTAEAAMQQSAAVFGDISASHRYHCESLPVKPPDQSDKKKDGILQRFGL